MDFISVYPIMKRLGPSPKYGHIPSFEGETGCQAGAKFFGVPLSIAENLFLAGDPATSAYKTRQPSRKAVLAQLEILRMKKLVELERGGLIEVKEFEAVE